LADKFVIIRPPLSVTFDEVRTLIEGVGAEARPLGPKRVEAIGDWLMKRFLIFKSSTVTSLEWPRGFQEVKVPRFHDNGTEWW
jgi:hypothetical protein